MRILDEIEKELKGRGQSIPYTHWPSSASAWLDCDQCGGTGHIAVGIGTEGDVSLCDVEECQRGKILHGACLRAEYYKALGITKTEPIDPGGYLKMDAGNAIEDLILGLARKHATFVRQVEVWLSVPSLEESMHGYIDALEIDPDGLLIPWEVKSSYGRGVKQVRDSGIKTDHWLQVCLYIRALWAKFPGHQIGPPKFIYVGRDNFYRAEIDKPVDADTIMAVTDACIERWVELEGHVNELSIPAGDYVGKGGKKGHWRCRYCGWRTKCKERERELATEEECRDGLPAPEAKAD